VHQHRSGSCDVALQHGSDYTDPIEAVKHILVRRNIPD